MVGEAWMEGDKTYIVVRFQQIVNLILRILSPFSIRMYLIEEHSDIIIIHDCPALIHLRPDRKPAVLLTQKTI